MKKLTLSPLKDLAPGSFWSSDTLLRHLVVFALPCLLCWSIYFLAYYPGMMSRDSLDQWRPVLTFDFDDWHPAILSYLYWLFTRIWNSPAIICIAQMIGLSVVVAYGMQHLEKQGLPNWALVLLTAFYGLFPLNGFYVNTLFKDVPFAIAFLLAFLYLLRVVDSKGRWLTSTINLASLAFALGFLWVIRHNGILTVLALLGGLTYAYWSFLRRIGVLLVLTLAVVFLVKGVLYQVIEVHGRFYGIEMLVTHQIAAVIHSGATLTEDEYTSIEKVLPLSSWKNNYNPYEVDDLVFDGHFNYLLLDQESARKEYLMTWFGIAIRNLPALVQHQLKVTDLVWNVGLQKGSYNYAVHPLIDPNDMGLQMQSLLPELKQFLTKAINFCNRTPILRALLLRPATFIYFSLLIFLLLSRYMSAKQVFLVATPFLSLVLGLMLTIPAQHVRYLYPCFLMAPFLAAYWLILRKRGTAPKKAASSAYSANIQ